MFSSAQHLPTQSFPASFLSCVLNPFFFCFFQNKNNKQSWKQPKIYELECSIATWEWNNATRSWKRNSPICLQCRKQQPNHTDYEIWYWFGLFFMTFHATLIILHINWKQRFETYRPDQTSCILCLPSQTSLMNANARQNEEKIRKTTKTKENQRKPKENQTKERKPKES